MATEIPGSFLNLAKFLSLRIANNVHVIRVRTTVSTWDQSTFSTKNQTVQHDFSTLLLCKSTHEPHTNNDHGVFQ
jgi:hypothetical protein